MYQPTYLSRPYMVKSPFFKGDFCASLLAKIRGFQILWRRGMSHLKPFKLTHVLFEKEDPLGEIMAFLTISPVLVAASCFCFFFCIFFLKNMVSPPGILLISCIIYLWFSGCSIPLQMTRYWAHFWRIESFTCFHFRLSNPPRIRWRKKSAC